MVEPIKLLKRRKFVSHLSEKAGSIATAFFNANENGASISGLTIKEWSEKMHIPPAAVAALKAMGADESDDVSDFAFLESNDLKGIAQTLLETSTFLDAWWFEHGMAYTLNALAPAGHTEL